jgi:hypothetical protein
MSATDQTVQVILELPKEVYRRIEARARKEQRPPEDLLSALVAEGLEAHSGVREIYERISDRYRDRLSHEDQLHLTPEEVLQELRAIREQIAHELYP